MFYEQRPVKNGVNRQTMEQVIQYISSSERIDNYFCSWMGEGMIVLKLLN